MWFINAGNPNNMADGSEELHELVNEPAVYDAHGFLIGQETEEFGVWEEKCPGCW